MKFICALIILLSCVAAQALTLENILKDPKEEQLAQDIFREIRCVVCNGQSIADSRAELAGGLREIIRSKIRQGDSKAQILEYLVSKYGDSILMQPPLNLYTYLLWFGPLLVMFLGVIIMCMYLRRRNIVF